MPRDVGRIRATQLKKASPIMVWVALSLLGEGYCSGRGIILRVNSTARSIRFLAFG